MLFRKVVFLLMAGFATELVISCACKCADSRKCQYTFDSFSTGNIDTSGLHAIVTNADTIPKASFGLKFQFALSSPTTCKLGKTSFFSEAHAADCVCPPPIQYTARDTMVTFAITTINAFDGQHPAGVDVSEYFKVIVPNSGYQTVAEFLKTPEITFADLSSGEGIAMLLTTSPAASGTQSFKIDISLSNNTSLTYTSKPVYLK